MVIYLERGADLHMAQLMPLPLTVSCSRKIQIGITFLVPAYPGCPGKEAVKCCSSVVSEKVPEGSTLVVVDTRISFSHRVGLVERSLHAKMLIIPFIPFDSTPTCDRRTRTQDHS